MTKPEFEDLMVAMLSPWVQRPADHMLSAYYGALDDLSDEALRDGADHILRTRLRERGLPSPADWRAAAADVAMQRAVHRQLSEQRAKLKRDLEAPIVLFDFLKGIAETSHLPSLRAKARLMMLERGKRRVLEGRDADG